MTTWPTCPWSAKIAPSAVNACSKWMWDPIVRPSNRCSVPTASDRTKVRGATVSRRPWASTWAVRLAARSEAAKIASRPAFSSGADGICVPSPARPFSISPCPMMTVSRLLKSCAMPAASRPIPSIFCAWRSSPSRRCRVSAMALLSVMSMICTSANRRGLTGVAGSRGSSWIPLKVSKPQRIVPSGRRMRFSIR